MECSESFFASTVIVNGLPYHVRLVHRLEGDADAERS